MDPLDLDPGFEPQTRARSNTWPLPRPDNFVEGVDEGGKGGLLPPPCDVPKKNSSRRNAWGNMSYADLITQAIQSATDKRLTLAQIYEWMVQNVAYFKDKGDSNSSAGWKNSIRHNLSLHNRFMRVQNEGTGKSSWWMINPDAKPGKAARRRAVSMETHKYEKKRGRVKKKVEALRTSGATPSPSSSVSEGQDLFPESPFQTSGGLSPPDFRPRASSNASSCGGRLSPIPAADSDGGLPPLSPIPWNAPYDTTTALDRNFTTDHLVKSLSESMKLRCSGGDPDSGFGNLASDCAIKPVSNGQRGYGLPYYANSFSPSPPQQQQPSSQVLDGVNGRQYTLTRLQNLPQSQPLCESYRPLPPAYLDELRTPPLYKEIKEEPLPQVPPYHPQSHHHLLQQHHNHHSQQQQQQHHNTVSHHSNGGAPSGSSLSHTASHMVGHLLYNTLPQDLDFDPLPFECDVDQVIRHELSVEGNLDFNFDSSNGHGQQVQQQQSGGQQQQHHAARSWVH